ncbi:glycosyltransferase [Kitasatospora sp. RB6PN24]|uniref:glycosyltransferase n=1 Tax=Kitasatospora humi TaxID=2893891 RepID=UPI001E285771|nr:glycosyltransferase [Kitasatospora humi]MCC9305906.1 glycosyltransferase [Kitasatospora humi]
MTSALTIALVSEHASPLATLGGVDAGGQNVHVAALARALADRGHRVTVHTRRTDPSSPEHVRFASGVTVHHVAAGPPQPLLKDELLPHMPAFGDQLARYWAVRRPDLAHAHFWMSGLGAVRGARRHRLPVLQTYHALGAVKRRHQAEADTSPPTRIAIETAVGRSVAAVIATCRDEVAELVAMGVPAERISVVPCGVDPFTFEPLGPVAARTERPRLLVVGRLIPRKQVDLVVDSLVELPGVELLVAGGPPVERLDEDPEARRLLARARSRGVAGRLTLLGGMPADRMPALIRSADVVVCPARYEPFGIVPLEAMACGVPVVATAVGGHLDTVVDRGTGLLVAPDSADALTAAIAALLREPATRAAYGAAGRRRILDRFTWERVAAGTEQIYREVLARPAPAAPRGRRGSAARPATRTRTGAP